MIAPAVNQNASRRRTYWLRLAGALVLASASSMSSAADVVVVCPDHFRDALQPWCQVRSGEGLTLAFCRPARTAEGTLSRVRESADASTRYVVLVGDAPPFAPRPASDPVSNVAVSREPEGGDRIPLFYLPSKVTGRFGSTPTYPSDLPYGDFDNDGVIDAAVGRMPVTTPAQLTALVERIVAYESSHDFGSWRRSFQLTAGVGGFGMMVDGAIESVTRTVLTSVLPADAKPQIAYASPGHAFCPPGESFRDAVWGRYENGARFWVYAGHGSIDQLNFLTRSATDAAALTRRAATMASPASPAATASPAAMTSPAEGRTTSDGRWQVESLLDNQTVSQLIAPRGRSPIAIVLACYAGAYDAPGDCLAERMLLTPGGPITVIAASRLTMPYGNARFGLGLLESAYSEVGAAAAPARLGDAMRSAVKRMQVDEAGSTTQLMVDGLASLISPAGIDLADERREHAGLYQLLGDPTLNLQSPQPLAMAVNSPESGTAQPAGSTFPGPDPFLSGPEPSPRPTVCVSVTSPIAGKLTVCVDRPLTAVSNADAVVTAADDPHGCTLGQVTIHVESNIAGMATITLPTDWVGPVVVRGFVQGRDSWASGAARTVVESSF